MQCREYTGIAGGMQSELGIGDYSNHFGNHGPFTTHSEILIVLIHAEVLDFVGISLYTRLLGCIY